LSKPEYYHLRPDLLQSGGSFVGGFGYSLGTLFDSFKSGNHFYFDEVGVYKKLYLISMAGSVLSGVNNTMFWSDDINEIVNFNSNDSPLPKPFAHSLMEFEKMVRGTLANIDCQDKVVEQLIKEINKLNELKR
jgi:hypothetical protein